MTHLKKKYIILIAVLLAAIPFLFLKRQPELYVLGMGGDLESQLFSYVAQMGYANEFGKDVCLIKEHTVFDLPYRVCKKNEIDKAKQKKCKFKNFENVMEDDSCSFLVGRVFEDKRFFEKGKKHILSDLVFKRFNNKRVREMEKKITSTNSVAIHIRRGDYAKRGIPMIRLPYYRKATNYIQAHQKEPIHLFIFSDNIKWVKKAFKHFKLEYAITFVEGNSKEVDMYLMSLCHHDVIANSPHSWWAAYLNKNPNKIVIMPTVWGKNNIQRLYKDISPQNWKGIKPDVIIPN